MSLKNPLVFVLSQLLLILLVGNTFAENKPAPNNSTNQQSDTALCKTIANQYCKLWKAQYFDSMYVMLNESGMEAMPKEQFLNTYMPESDNAGKLAGYAVKKAEIIQDGIVVKVGLRFGKEKLPVMVNGVFNFHLKRDKRAWKIQAVVGPVKMPMVEEKRGVGHPGE